MKRLRLAIAALLLINLFAACSAHINAAHISGKDMVEAAIKLDEQFKDSFNRGDLEGVMATYWKSQEVFLSPPDVTEVRGWGAIRAEFTDFFKSSPGVSFEFYESAYQV